MQIFNMRLAHESAYKFECFKVKTPRNELLNFVFVNRSCDKALMWTSLDVINDFDMDLSKVFYSYKFDSIFMHMSFFRPYRSLYVRLDRPVADLALYTAKLNEMKPRACEMSVKEFEESLAHDFKRFAKYSFKGYANTKKEIQLCIGLIEFYYPKYIHA